MELKGSNGVVEGHTAEVGEVKCNPILVEEDSKGSGDKAVSSADDGSLKPEEEEEYNDNGENLVSVEQSKPELSDITCDHVPESHADTPVSRGFMHADDGHDDSQTLLNDGKGPETEVPWSGETEGGVRVLEDRNCNTELQDLENEGNRPELHSLVNGCNEQETASGDREIETACAQYGENEAAPTCAGGGTLGQDSDNEVRLESSVHGDCKEDLPCVAIEQPESEIRLSVEVNSDLQTQVLANGNRETESHCIVNEENPVELQCGVNEDGEQELHRTTTTELESDVDPESQCSANRDNDVGREAHGEEVGHVQPGNGEISDLESDSCNGSNIDGVSDLPGEKPEACNDTQQSDAKEADWVSAVDPEPSHGLLSSAGDSVDLVEAEPSNEPCCPAVALKPSNGVLSSPALMVNGDNNIAKEIPGEKVEDVQLGNDGISDLESGSCNGSSIDGVSDLPEEKAQVCNGSEQPDAKEDGWVSAADPNPSHRLLSSAGDWVSTVDAGTSSELSRHEVDWTPVVNSEPSNGILNPPALANQQKSEADVPKKKVYCLVKIPRHVDNKIKAQIRLAQLQLNEKTERRDFIRAALQMKRSSREEALDKLRTARYEERTSRDAIKCKRQEMEPVQLALNKMKNATSVEEVEEKIYYMEYRIEHETMPLREEKQLVREINQLKLSRDQLCASAGPHSELQEAFDQIDKIQERNKILGQELDSLRKQAFQVEKNTQEIEKDFVALNDALKQLQGQWNAADIARQEAYEALRALKKQEYERNNEFYNNKGDIQAAKQHALAGDTDALDELCSNQVERIMEMWNKSAEFRKEYVKDNERSTLKRLETLDGRSLGPDEEPPLPTSYNDDLDSSSVPQGKPSSLNAKHEREDRLVTAIQQSNEEESKTNWQLTPSDKAVVPKKSSAGKPWKPQPEFQDSVPKIESFEMDPVSVKNDKEDLAKREEEAAKLKESKEDLAKREEEAAKLKERRRLEEITKAKEAEERKRRLAEKAKAKANARAQKESERKEKERQKRANKKAAAAAAAAAATAANTVGDDSASLADKVQADTSQNSKSSAADETKETVTTSRKPATSQQKKLVSQKSKPRSILLSAKNVKKGPQRWMWILLVVVVFLFVLLLTKLYL